MLIGIDRNAWIIISKLRVEKPDRVGIIKRASHRQHFFVMLILVDEDQFHCASPSLLRLGKHLGNMIVGWNIAKRGHPDWRRWGLWLGWSIHFLLALSG
jgi:hypothetical protein